MKLLIESELWDVLDEANQRVDQLNKMILHNDQKKPVVIYIHCEAGTDRTGEVSGGYYMKY